MSRTRRARVRQRPAAGGIRDRRHGMDVLALVVGLLAVAYASSLILVMLRGPIDPSLIGVVAPASLVVIGLIGLLAGSGKS